MSENELETMLCRHIPEIYNGPYKGDICWLMCSCGWNMDGNACPVIEESINWTKHVLEDAGVIVYDS